MSDIFDHEADAFERLLDGDEDYYIPAPKTCKYCGEKGFKWGQTENGWRLVKKGQIHNCSSFRR
jgi:hypothetical protein